MADGKKSFVLYCDQIHAFEALEDDEAGRLIKHIFKYVNDQDPQASDRITKISFEPIKHQLKRDLKKWEDKSPGRIEKAHKAGLASGEARRTKKNLVVKNELNELDSTKRTANVNVTVNDNVTDTVNVKKNHISSKVSTPQNAAKKNENMLVIEMIKTFRAKKKSYIVDETVDYPACLQIAYHIAKLKGWKKMDVVGEKEDDVLLSWKKIVDFLVSDKWFTTRTLSDIAGKEWNRIEPSMKSLKNGTHKKDMSGGYDTGIKDSSIYDKMK